MEFGESEKEDDSGKYVNDLGSDFGRKLMGGGYDKKVGRKWKRGMNLKGVF